MKTAENCLLKVRTSDGGNCMYIFWRFTNEIFSGFVKNQKKTQLQTPHSKRLLNWSWGCNIRSLVLVLHLKFWHLKIIRLSAFPDWCFNAAVAAATSAKNFLRRFHSHGISLIIDRKIAHFKDCSLIARISYSQKPLEAMGWKSFWSTSNLVFMPLYNWKFRW